MQYIVIDIEKNDIVEPTHIHMEYKLLLIKYNKIFKYPSNHNIVIVVKLQIYTFINI